MSLIQLDAEERAKTTTHGLPCSVGKALDLLDPADLAAITEWFAVPAGTKGRRSDRYLADLLTRETGQRVTTQPLGHHRRGACRCAT